MADDEELDMEEHGMEGMQLGGAGIRKKGNILTLWGNEKTMNLNSMVLTNIQQSPYYKVQLSEFKTYHEVVQQIYNHVNHLEPWEKGSRRTSGQIGMCGGVRGVGAGGIVSSAFCLLYKLFTLKLTRKQLNGLLNHEDSPYLRGMGFMYVRFCQPPPDLWEWFEPYLDDTEEVDPKAGGGDPMTIGQMVRHLLTRLDWYGTLFPRVPVPVQKQIDQKLTERRQQMAQRFQETHRQEAAQRTSDERNMPPPRQDTEKDNRRRSPSPSAKRTIPRRPSPKPYESRRRPSPRRSPSPKRRRSPSPVRQKRSPATQHRRSPQRKRTTSPVTKIKRPASPDKKVSRSDSPQRIKKASAPESRHAKRFDSRDRKSKKMESPDRRAKKRDSPAPRKRRSPSPVQKRRLSPSPISRRKRSASPMRPKKSSSPEPRPRVRSPTGSKRGGRTGSDWRKGIFPSPSARVASPIHPGRLRPDFTGNGDDFAELLEMEKERQRLARLLEKEDQKDSKSARTEPDTSVEDDGTVRRAKTSPERPKDEHHRKHKHKKHRHHKHDREDRSKPQEVDSHENGQTV